MTDVLLWLTRNESLVSSLVSILEIVGAALVGAVGMWWLHKRALADILANQQRQRADSAREDLGRAQLGQTLADIGAQIARVYTEVGRSHADTVGRLEGIADAVSDLGARQTSTEARVASVEQRVEKLERVNHGPCV